MRIIGKMNKSVIGTNQDDSIDLNGKADAWGRRGDDYIDGSPAANKIYGDDGNDVIYNGGGNDTVDGGRGNDYIYNIDSFYSRYPIYYSGNVRFFGGAGDDAMIGGLGNDFLDGGDGNDYLAGYSGKDTVRGGNGDDVFSHYGYPGATYSGGAGHDTLRFEEYDRSPYDPDGNFPSTVDDNKPWLDVRVTGEAKGEFGISSGPGAEDYIREGTFTGMNAFSAWDIHQLFYKGGNSDNTVAGSDNNDFLVGGSGNEKFSGDFGDDTFVYHIDRTGMGHDQILDYANIDADGNPTGNGLGVDTVLYSYDVSDGFVGHTEAIDFGDWTTFYLHDDTAPGSPVIHTLDVIGAPDGMTDIVQVENVWFL